ncbi:MAG: ATP-binding protein [Nannocystales bacterium]
MHDGPRAWGVLRTLLGISVGLMAGLAGVAYSGGNHAGAWVLIVGATMAAPALLVKHRPGLLYWVGNYTGALVLCVVLALAWIRGGLLMEITAWLALIPMIASMVGRGRVALGWGAVVVVLTTLLAVAEACDWTPRGSRPPLFTRWLSQVGLVMLTLWLVRRVRNIARERQKTLSDQAVAGQKLESLGRLAGGIAHDFNNVLAVVLARVDDVMQDTGVGHPQYDDLRAIRTAAKRGASLASELVAFSRRGPATYDVMRPIDVVRGAEQVLGRLIRENVEIVVEADRTVEPIEGDRDHLLQVLLNLAINAQDAMPDGGRLRIQLWADTVTEPTGAATGVIPPGRYAVLTVSDEGSGMSPEVQSRVFEPFFTTKDRGRGSGIGLATVHAIITQHGGHVRLSSELGVGSSFEVFLPLTRRSAELRETTDDTVGPEDRRRLRVLLVEDDALVRRALEVMLSRAGHRLVAAANGAEALARWEEAPEPFHLVLTDVLMPGMTGPDLVRQLRMTEPDLRVVYMSGHVEDAMRDVDLEREHALFVRKPASRAALLDAMEQATAQGGP